MQDILDMKTDTPRTDAFAAEDNGDSHSAYEFMRELERELAAVTSQRNAMRSLLMDIRNAGEVSYQPHIDRIANIK